MKKVNQEDSWKTKIEDKEGGRAKQRSELQQIRKEKGEGKELIRKDRERERESERETESEEGVLERVVCCW